MTSEDLPGRESQIRVIKERARSIRIKPSLQRLPKRTIIEMMGFVVMQLNAFPFKSGVAKTYTPYTVMIETSLDYTTMRFMRNTHP